MYIGSEAGMQACQLNRFLSVLLTCTHMYAHKRFVVSAVVSASFVVCPGAPRAAGIVCWVKHSVFMLQRAHASLSRVRVLPKALGLCCCHSVGVVCAGRQ